MYLGSQIIVHDLISVYDMDIQLPKDIDACQSRSYEYSPRSVKLLFQYPVPLQEYVDQQQYYWLR